MTDALDASQREEDVQQPDDECGGVAWVAEQCIDKSKAADDKGAVAFAERAVVTAAVAMHRAQHAAKFAQRREIDENADGKRVKRRDQGKGQIERGIGDDVGDFVEVAAERRSLPELAREHSVHRVQRHAQEKPQRQEQEQRRVGGKAREGDTQRDGNGAGEDCHLIGGRAARMEATHQRPQQVLEFGFKGVDAHGGLYVD